MNPIYKHTYELLKKTLVLKDKIDSIYSNVYRGCIHDGYIDSSTLKFKHVSEQLNDAFTSTPLIPVKENDYVYITGDYGLTDQFPCAVGYSDEEESNPVLLSTSFRSQNTFYIPSDVNYLRVCGYADRDVVVKINYLENSISYITNLSQLSQPGTYYLAPTDYYLNEILSLPSNIHIIGNANSRIIVSNECYFLIDTKENVIIERVSFVGANTFSPSSFESVNSILNRENIGQNIGLKIVGRQCSTIIDKCNFSNFNNSGIHLRIASNGSSGSQNKNLLIITNSYFKHCYIGIYCDLRLEYSTMSDLHISDCNIGIWCESGNMKFCNICADCNSVGFVLSGILTGNEAHSTISCCSFNHNRNYAFVCSDIRNGMMITGCNFYETGIYINNSRGLVFNGNNISVSNFTFVGGQRSGPSSVINNLFQPGYGVDSDEDISNEDNLPLLIDNNISILNG